MPGCLRGGELGAVCDREGDAAFALSRLRRFCEQVSILISGQPLKSIDSRALQVKGSVRG